MSIQCSNLQCFIKVKNNFIFVLIFQRDILNQNKLAGSYVANIVKDGMVSTDYMAQFWFENLKTLCFVYLK